MNCPLCIDEVLDVSHRGGIEVDVCPRCRGVWLDRGELERLMAEEPPTARPARSAPDRDVDRYTDDDVDRVGPDRGGRGGRASRKKRLSERLGDVLEEVLDL